MKLHYILGFAFLFLGNIQFGYAQESATNTKTDFDLGKDKFEVFEYYKAIRYFKNALEKDSTDVETQLFLAKSYYRLRDFESAEFWANRIVSQTDITNNEYIFYYIEILAANRHYDEASYWYKIYLEGDSINPDHLTRMEGYLKIGAFEDYSRQYKIEPISINSDKPDFSPAYLKDSIVFVSGRDHGLNVKKVFNNDEVSFLNLYVTKKEGETTFSEPKKFSGKIKTGYNEGPVAFYDDGTKVIFTQNGVKKRSFLGNRMERNDSGLMNLQLYMADYKDGGIHNIVPFPYNNPEFSSGHPTVSKDGKTLIYASNRPDTNGGSDLYLCHRVNDSWTPPVNLGPIVNTKGNELFPFLNNGVLYFSSDGHEGIGGLDIYKVILFNDQPTELFNLGYPLNSSKDDFGYASQDGQSGYFCTNRGTPMNDEIYSFRFSKPKITSLVVIDSVTLDTLVSPTIYFNEVGGEIVGLLPAQVVDNEVFYFDADTSKKYDILVQQDGYIPLHYAFPNGVDEFKSEIVIPVGPIDTGTTFVIPNIYYDFDKVTLRDSSKIELNYLASWMLDNPMVKIEVRAHTDNRGTASYNLKLSEGRAKSVMDYLSESGIEIDRLTSVGLGESEPVMDCPTSKDCTEAQHQLNRRTEFRVKDF